MGVLQSAGISDLERAVARLAASTVEGAAGRDADHVVLYEDAARLEGAAGREADHVVPYEDAANTRCTDLDMCVGLKQGSGGRGLLGGVLTMRCAV
eukprot:1156580-Pelagomonas_calceolata.AAC.9